MRLSIALTTTALLAAFTIAQASPNIGPTSTVARASTRAAATAPKPTQTNGNENGDEGNGDEDDGLLFDDDESRGDDEGDDGGDDEGDASLSQTASPTPTPISDVLNAMSQSLAAHNSAALQKFLSTEYAAFTMLVGKNPELSAVLYPAQEALTKDINPSNAVAHISTYLAAVASAMSPKNTAIPARSKKNTAGSIRPALPFVAAAAAFAAAFF
ncbi:hypothetical protein GGI12_000657 [Dipsacomyces acuminosporus]|nr:hypothetical protein GGI12_000657 [Dipsacomyces acuminosporus]